MRICSTVEKTASNEADLRLDDTFGRHVQPGPWSGVLVSEYFVAAGV